jgi:hypothetical protein
LELQGKVDPAALLQETAHITQSEECEHQSNRQQVQDPAVDIGCDAIREISSTAPRLDDRGEDEWVTVKTHGEGNEHEHYEGDDHDEVAHDIQKLSPVEQVILHLLVHPDLLDILAVLVAIVEYSLLETFLLLLLKPLEIQLVVPFLKQLLLCLQQAPALLTASTRLGICGPRVIRPT